MSLSANVTELIETVSDGSEAARDELMVVVYDELRRLADLYMQQDIHQKKVKDIQTVFLFFQEKYCSPSNIADHLQFRFADLF